MYAAVKAEAGRQASQLELIASENFVSPAVLEAMGTVLTNKYAEGLPGKRYYGGCEHVDVVEDLARDRAKALFKADHANVQPHAGAQANMAAFLAFLKAGDRILGMNLSHGGHLTHGSPVNFSGTMFEVGAYGVRDSDGRIDYDAVRDQALAEKPKLIIAGASAYPRIIDFEAFSAIAKEVGAVLLVDMAHIAGLVATGVHPNPVPHCRRGDHHDPQNPSGPAGRADPLQGGAREGHRQSGLPGNPGRATHARHRGQGRGLQGGPGAGIPVLHSADRGQRPGPGRAAS